MKKTLLMATAFSALLFNVDSALGSGTKNEQGWLNWAIGNVAQAYVCTRDGVCKVTNGVNTFLDVNISGTKEYVSEEVKKEVDKSFAVCKRKLDIASSKDYNDNIVKIAYDPKFENWYKQTLRSDVNFFKGKLHSTYIKFLYHMQDDLTIKKSIIDSYSTADNKLNDQVLAITNMYMADCDLQYETLLKFLAETNNLYGEFKKSNPDQNQIKERFKDVLRFIIKVASDPDVQKIIKTEIEKFKSN